LRQDRFVSMGVHSWFISSKSKPLNKQATKAQRAMNQT
jgi:hypothetical protein